LRLWALIAPEDEPLSEQLLEKRAGAGLRIHVGGSGITFIVAFTADEIADQLAAARFESDRLSKK
jgi:hypothetical protein